MNTLYYGDNLKILREHIMDESVDLVYLDPPFKSNQDYNVLFKEQSGTRAAAQIMAFEDTWKWDTSAQEAYEDEVKRGGKTGKVMEAFHTFLGKNDMLAYLAMMAPRLIELRRVLKPTGSIYLHCDSTASHYLKMLMDAVFGLSHYRNEIIWRRTPFSGSSKARARQYPRSHDVLLFYSRGESWVWHQPTVPYSDEYLTRFKWDDSDGRGPYRKTLLKTFSKETFERLKADNRLIPPTKNGAKWSYKQYLSESSGSTQIDDNWTDINAINPVARERLGYATQKPEALLERIIEASSDAGNVVLDPFCGCGTSVAVAQRLKRKWVGIDITHLAIKLIKERLKNSFGGKLKYKVVGEPEDLESARTLAADDKYEFQWWALSLVDAAPEKDERKKGPDRGIDGVRTFFDGKNRTPTHIMFSVKGGGTSVKDVRDLGHVVQREKAAIGVLITLEKPTAPMLKEAVAAGFYHSDYQDTKHPKLQIITIGDLLKGKQLDLPILAQMKELDATYAKAPRARLKKPVNGELDV